MLGRWPCAVHMKSCFPSVMVLFTVNLIKTNPRHGLAKKALCYNYNKILQALWFSGITPTRLQFVRSFQAVECTHYTWMSFAHLYVDAGSQLLLNYTHLNICRYFYSLSMKVEGDIGILSSVRLSISLFPLNTCVDGGYRLFVDCLSIWMW